MSFEARVPLALAARAFLRDRRVAYFRAGFIEPAEL